MKKIIAGVLMATFIIASTGVQAQRGGRGGNGGGSMGGGRGASGGNMGGGRSFGGGGSSQPSRSFSQSSPDRNVGQQPSRSFSQPQRNITQSQPQRNFNQPQRDVSTQQRNFPQQQGSFRSQPNIATGRNFGPGNRNVVVQNNFYGNRGGYRGYTPHYRPIGTYHYHSSPRLVVSIGGPYRTIPWLGIPYNYYNGYWYRPYGASFQIIAPPFGIRISSLPFGYSPIYGPWGDYYYYNNIFYRHPVNDNSQYEVVDAPLGAQVPELPKGAEVRVIDAQKYYELDGNFYKEDLRDGQIWYTVVGKNGVLSTQDDTAIGTTPSNTLSNGDRISILPDGSKSVTINGQQLYIAPDGNYYQQVIDGNNTWYEVVGQ